MLNLVKPDVQYKDSYLASLREEGEPSFPRHYIDDLDKDFGAFVHRLMTFTPGEYQAPDGKTYALDKNHHYWLVENGTFIGDVNVRPVLNPFMESYGGHIGYRITKSKRGQGYGREMLALALRIAQNDLGMKSLTVICSPNNIASKRVIEKNGGVFEKTAAYDWTDAVMDVYRISF